MWILADTPISDPIINAVLITPFVGLLFVLGRRSWKLIQCGGMGAFLGVIGYFPLLAAIWWGVSVLIQSTKGHTTCIVTGTTNILTGTPISLCTTTPPTATEALIAGLEIVVPGLILVGIGWVIQAVGEMVTGTNLPSR